MNIERNQTTRSQKVATVAVGLSTIIVIPPLFFLVIVSWSPGGTPSLEDWWLSLWSLTALGIGTFNLAMMPLLWRQNRQDVVRKVSLASMLIILTCPFLWMLFRS